MNCFGESPFDGCSASTLQRAVFPVHVRKEVVGSGSIGEACGRASEPTEHDRARQRAYTLQEPTIRRRDLRVLDSYPRRVLDEGCVAREGKLGLDPRREDHIEAPGQAKDDLDPTRWKLRLGIGRKGSLLPDFREGICRERFCVRAGHQELVIRSVMQRHPLATVHWSGTHGAPVDILTIDLDATDVLEEQQRHWASQPLLEVLFDATDRVGVHSSTVSPKLNVLLNPTPLKPMV